MRIVQELGRVGDQQKDQQYQGQKQHSVVRKLQSVPGGGGIAQRGGRKHEGRKIGPHAVDAPGLYSVEASEKTNSMRDGFKTKQKQRRQLRV